MTNVTFAARVDHVSDLDGRGLVVAVFLEEVEDLGADPALGPRLQRPGHVLPLQARQGNKNISRE